MAEGSNLKAKAEKMREQSALFEAQEQTTREQLKKAEARRRQYEEEKRYYLQKIKDRREKLRRVEDMTDQKLDRLERFNKTIHETEVAIRKLEKKELKDDAVIKDLESDGKSMKMIVEEADQRRRDSLNRLKQLETEIDAVDGRIEAARRKEEWFGRKLEEQERKVQVKILQEEKGDDYESIMRRLKDLKEQTVIEAENWERKCDYLLEKKIRPYQKEFEQKIKEVDEIEKDLREIMDEVNTFPR